MGVGRVIGPGILSAAADGRLIGGGSPTGGPCEGIPIAVGDPIELTSPTFGGPIGAAAPKPLPIPRSNGGGAPNERGIPGGPREGVNPDIPCVEPYE